MEIVDDTRCPYCGSDDIKGIGTTPVYNNDAWEDTQACMKCGKKFWVIYKPVRIEDEFSHVIKGGC